MHCRSRFPLICLCIHLGYTQSPSWELFSLQKLTLHISIFHYVLILNLTSEGNFVLPLT